MLAFPHGYLSGARCRLAYGPADATATQCLCFSKIQIGFTFLVPAYPGSPGKGPLNGCMYGMYGYLLFENCLHDGLSLEHCLLKTLHTIFQMNADLPVAA